MKKKNTRTEIIELLKASCPDIARHVEGIEQYLHAYEYLDVHQWIGTRWYAVVVDTRGRLLRGVHPSNLRFGLTLDVKNGGSIMWSDEGGNCFVRATKWKVWAKRHFNLGRYEIFSERFHVYKDRYLAEVRKALNETQNTDTTNL